MPRAPASEQENWNLSLSAASRFFQPQLVAVTQCFPSRVGWLPHAAGRSQDKGSGMLNRTGLSF